MRPLSKFEHDLRNLLTVITAAEGGEDASEVAADCIAAKPQALALLAELREHVTAEEAWRSLTATQRSLIYASLACVRGPGNVCARKPAPHLHLVPPPCPTCDGSGEVEADGDVPELAVERALCPDCFPEGT
ncbi:MAG: hypothetical protein M3Q61_05865 [Chloroflexota bacterium]|nr:hypothetical protein [Chloroflexota bacterium]